MKMSGHEPLYTAFEMRKVDNAAIQLRDQTGFALMTRAAEASFNLLKGIWPDHTKIQIFCGGGNNGGDGYLLASLAAGSGLQVVVWQVGDVSRISGDAALARKDAHRGGGGAFCNAN